MNAKIILGEAASKLNESEQFTLLCASELDQISKDRFPEIGELIGFKLDELKDFDLLVADDTIVQIEKLGKKAKKHITDESEILICTKGLYCRIIKGTINKTLGNIIHQPKVFKSLVITLSDRAARGEYDDLSGPLVINAIDEIFESKNKRFKTDYQLIPDSRKQLSDLLLQSKNKYDVIITTGGTGIGPRDFTVDVVEPMLDMEIPGIMEMIRMKYGIQKPNAYLSRGIAGVFGTSLIYTLPGSVKAVREYMDEIAKTMDHLFYMKAGIDVH